MNKQEIYALLDRKQIPYEAVEHIAVYNMEQAAQIQLPYPEDEAKNLFVRDDKKRNYYLITVKGDKRVDLREFRQQHGTRALSFASAEDLMAMMGLIPGAVTPLGLLNDDSRSIRCFLDDAFLENGAQIGVHPNDNTATVFLPARDLIGLLEEHGTAVEMVRI